MNMAIIVFVSFALSIAISMETIGVWGRVIGSMHGKPTQGYSLHVRAATGGRFFAVLAGPLLGLLVDRGVQANYIAICGFLTFILCFMYSAVVLKFDLFSLLERAATRRLKLGFYLAEKQEKKINPAFCAKVAASYSLTASG
ncbi:MAG: hypothetical protein Q8Q63_07400, partial [Phaeovulum sp.]|uniref:hypothetical protein n=1 Tax=Phaeovulum sp. TaxID=2934796 RepID=UPI00273510FF